MERRHQSTPYRVILRRDPLVILKREAPKNLVRFFASLRMTGRGKPLVDTSASFAQNDRARQTLVCTSPA
jgi:hypothetical protein